MWGLTWHPNPACDPTWSCGWYGPMSNSPAPCCRWFGDDMDWSFGGCFKTSLSPAQLFRWGSETIDRWPRFSDNQTKIWCSHKGRLSFASRRLSWPPWLLPTWSDTQWQWWCTSFVGKRCEQKVLHSRCPTFPEGRWAEMGEVGGSFTYHCERTFDTRHTPWCRLPRPRRGSAKSNQLEGFFERWSDRRSDLHMRCRGTPPRWVVLHHKRHNIGEGSHFRLKAGCIVVFQFTGMRLEHGFWGIDLRLWYEFAYKYRILLCNFHY